MADREKIISAIEKAKKQSEKYGLDSILVDFKAADMILELLKDQKPINYVDCSNAMLKMWMENVLTDGEYSRIMDKLNKAYKAEKL